MKQAESRCVAATALSGFSVFVQPLIAPVSASTNLYLETEPLRSSQYSSKGMVEKSDVEKDASLVSSDRYGAFTPANGRRVSERAQLSAGGN